jgi:hypothetical protein
MITVIKDPSGWNVLLRSIDIRARDAAYVKPVMRDCIEACGKTFRIVDETEFRCEKCREIEIQRSHRQDLGEALNVANNKLRNVI